MKEIVDKIIELQNKDNSNFLAQFPRRKSIFSYRTASDEDIKEFENEFNLKLSKELLEYFKLFDPIKSNLMFAELLGLAALKEKYHDFSGYGEALDQGLIPIADEDGDLICVSTKREKGRLLRYSHEDDVFQDVRDTFESYLTKLIEEKNAHIKRGESR